MLTIEAVASLQKIMASGFSDGSLAPTEIRCGFCEKSCKEIPTKCDEYKWDFEMKANIFKEEWEA